MAGSVGRAPGGWKGRARAAPPAAGAQAHDASRAAGAAVGRGAMRFDEGSASCLVYTFKEGMLSAVAHDLKVRVGRFTIEIDGLEAGAPSALRASFETGSLRVECSMKNGSEQPGQPGDGDRRKIEQAMSESVLQPGRWPVARYEVSELPGASEWVKTEAGALVLDGRLTLAGVERPLGCAVRRERGAWVVEAEVNQTHFGIRPFTAALGTLRVKPVVRVRVEVPYAVPGPS
ncbi:MAG: hypothetical protein EOO75_06600 [Myxococcales bacterium]|nr:MAG: hypothetical protein EOO75_06600 [Myxococcales bacterium]